MPIERWKCQECDHTVATDEWLSAPNPFDPSNEIVGCPACKAVNSFDALCEWPDCDQKPSSGTPLADGRYVWRCYDHRPEATGEKVRA